MLGLFRYKSWYLPYYSEPPAHWGAYHVAWKARRTFDVPRSSDWLSTCLSGYLALVSESTTLSRFVRASLSVVSRIRPPPFHIMARITLSVREDSQVSKGRSVLRASEKLQPQSTYSLQINMKVDHRLQRLWKLLQCTRFCKCALLLPCFPHLGNLSTVQDASIQITCRWAGPLTFKLQMSPPVSTGIFAYISCRVRVLP